MVWGFVLSERSNNDLYQGRRAVDFEQIAAPPISTGPDWRRKQPVESFLFLRKLGDLNHRMNLKPAVVIVEHVYPGNLYMIAHVRQADFLFEVLAGFLGTCLSYGVDTDWLKHKEAALSRSVPIID